MTTQSWSSKVRHDSDAVFREWGAELKAKLAAVGLVQTADTGQINWASVVRAVTNAAAGYEIWRFNDTLQATAPIFLRVDYGTGSSTMLPRLQVSVGTSTNGAGVLNSTGAFTIARSIHAPSLQNTDIARNSFACHVEGFFGLNWKVEAGTTDAFFAIARTVDPATGNPTATGAIVIWGSGAVANYTATQALRFAATANAFTAQTVATHSALCLIPQAPTATTRSTGETQAFIAWTITPDIEPVVGVCGALYNEVPDYGTFSFAPFAGVTRTYIGCSDFAGPAGSISMNAAGGLRTCMLWE